MSNSKADATYYPSVHECGECGRRYATYSAADDCCGDWLELGDD